jgi:hypothetical protein
MVQTWFFEEILAPLLNLIATNQNSSGGSALGFSLFIAKDHPHLASSPVARTDLRVNWFSEIFPANILEITVYMLYNDGPSLLYSRGSRFRIFPLKRE